MNVRDASIGTAAAYALNLAWENAQAPLFVGYAGLWPHFPMCATAALGDVVLVALLYALIAVADRNANWFVALRWRQALVLVIVGGVAATGVEWWALFTDRWHYANMPVLPIVNVGLLPVLQMMLLPLAVFYMMRAAHRG